MNRGPKTYGVAAVVAAVIAIVGAVVVMRVADGVPQSRPPVTDARVAGKDEPGKQFTPAYYDQWENGPPSDPGFFPIGVWVQEPLRERDGVINPINYRELGINMFIGLWEFPFREDSAGRLAALEDAGLYVIAGGGGAPDAAADVELTLSLPGTDALVGYLLGDEQDMSTNPEHITPEQVTEWAQAVKAADPTRPVYNNWGKAFSVFPWIGAQDDEAGLRQYCAEVDIPSSDYYAATEGYEPADLHTPDFYGRAVSHVRNLCGAHKPAWGFVETGHPFNHQPGSWPPFSQDGEIAPATIEQAVWSMLAHGANGIIYFVHDFYPDSFTEDGVFDRPEAMEVVSRINAEIMELAPILNAQRQPTGLTVAGADATLRADAAGRYVVAAENVGANGEVSFTLTGAAGATVEVVGEERTIQADGSGTWTDNFDPWGHRVYRIAN